MHAQGRQPGAAAPMRLRRVRTPQASGPVSVMKPMARFRTWVKHPFVLVVGIVLD